VDAKRLEKVLQIALFTPGLNGRIGLPILVWGSIGIGKTQVVNEVVKSSGLDPVTIIAALREPSDFGGLPIPVQKKEGVVIEHAPPAWAVELAQKPSVVILDELTSTPPATQAALLRMVLEGRLGDFAFPVHTRFVGIANPEEEAAGGWSLAAPLLNRFGHVRLDPPTAEEWRHWLLVLPQDAPPHGSGPSVKFRIQKYWKLFYGMAKGTATGFMTARPLALNTRDDASGDITIPTPRTWEMAVRVYAGWLCVANEAEYTKDTLFDLIAAFVGRGSADEFCAYVERRLPSPESLFTSNFEGFHDLELDRKMAALYACAHWLLFVGIDSVTEPAIEVFLRLLNTIADTQADLVVIPLRLLLSQTQGIPQLEENPVARQILKKIGPLFDHIK
jgi:hypothetical protein